MFTIPNVISIVRLLCVPVFIWLLFGRDNRLAAAVLLAVLGATDWVDGFIARRYNQVTTLGKVLDPTADRLLLAVAVISILVYGAVPPAIAWMAIVREVSVAVLALVLGLLGAKRIDVNWWGKTGTFLLLFAFPLFLLGDGEGAAHVVALAFSITGLVAGWYAFFLYIPQGRRALREGRDAKQMNRTTNRESRR